MSYRRIAQLKTPAAFREYLAELGIELPFDEEILTGPEAPLARPYTLRDGLRIGNRICVQPMEGWDGTPDGRPSELTFRRWRRFGESGAKLIWGGEAAAVVPEGRANPNQLLVSEANLPELARLREALVESHIARFGSSRDLLVGLQLTHSGRFSRPHPDGRAQPVIVYHHPLLDSRFGIPPDYTVIGDAEVEGIIQRFVEAAGLAAAAGFAFVDIKHCHGYLGHEFLSAYTRPGPFGGSLENRTRFLSEIVQGIKARFPELRTGVRVSAFDFPPFVKEAHTGIGVPLPDAGEQSRWFGADARNPFSYCLEETEVLLSRLQDLGVELVNITAGCPYYNPHIQRPALFPPSDGYLPPEDPLAGVARQIQATAELKKKFPGLLLVGSAYSYLQEWLPNVAQAQVRLGRVDLVGLGRMMLAYPELPADVLAGKPLDRKRICRTFSDCTTAPRHGLQSGCYPLDEFYKGSSNGEKLRSIKSNPGPQRTKKQD